jgi:hypothetical protein
MLTDRAALIHFERIEGAVTFKVPEKPNLVRGTRGGSLAFLHDRRGAIEELRAQFDNDCPLPLRGSRANEALNQLSPGMVSSGRATI